MTTYQKFRKLDIDFSAIGLENRDLSETYFCTPEGAEIIGWAGIDGIHYCFIDGFDDMVFAVSPMNTPSDYVHPIARSFDDLLGLLVACGDMAALEQAHQWNKVQFEQFVADNPPSKKQQDIYDLLAKELSVIPNEAPFDYISELQAQFDYSTIRFTEDYYDPDMNPNAELLPTEWAVTYHGGFWGQQGQSGREISLGKEFLWGDERWIVPAVYACPEGIVIDICKQAEPEEIKAFIDKWDLYNENEHEYSRDEQRCIEREHPLNADFRPHLRVNGATLRPEHGCGTVWIPASCLQDGTVPEIDSKAALEHYGLDLSKGWMVRRSCFRLEGCDSIDLCSMELTLEPMLTEIPGTTFRSPDAGSSIALVHPLTGAEYTLTVHEYEKKEIDMSYHSDGAMEYPTHCHAMSYTLSPDIEGRRFMLKDRADADSPRLRIPRPNEFEPVTVASIGIIGGSDGPVAVFASGDASGKLRGAYSSLHFEPVDDVEWQIIFREKLKEDISVKLL